MKPDELVERRCSKCKHSGNCTPKITKRKNGGWKCSKYVSRYYDEKWEWK